MGSILTTGDFFIIGHRISLSVWSSGLCSGLAWRPAHSVQVIYLAGPVKNYLYRVHHLNLQFILIMLLFIGVYGIRHFGIANFVRIGSVCSILKGLAASEC